MATSETTAQPVPHLKIRPSRGWSAINVREIWQFRDLLLTLAGRDVKLRYKQTALGVVWVIFQPLAAAGIFALVFGRVAGLSSEGVSYFIFAYAGNLCWNAFSSTLTRASSCMVQNSGLVSKIYFPRMILPLSTLLSTLLDFVIALALLIVLLPIFGVPYQWNMLLLPVWLGLALMLSLGIGLFSAALMVSYRDIQHILPVFTNFLMFGSPVAYSVTEVPKDLMFLYMLNPLSGLLEAFRWSILGTGSLQPQYVGYAAAVSVFVFVLGAFSFRRMEKRFADVI